MYCSNCGSLILEGQYTCPGCGAYVGSTAQTYNVPNQNIQQVYYQNNVQYAQPEPGMKWFKFIIYFQLFLSAVSNIIYGFRIITGSHYGVTSKQLNYIYNYFDGLKTLDVCIGICVVLLGVLALITRFMLSGYKKCGPAMYIGYLIATIVISLVYMCAFYIIVTSVESAVSMSSDSYVSLVTSVILLILNIIYFRKRKHLFVN